MVDSHSRLAYFTSLVHQTSVHIMQTRFTSGRPVLLHLGRLTLDICSQYGRLAYFTCSLDICSHYHLFVRHLFTLCRLVLHFWQTRFTSLGQTRVRHQFTIWQTLLLFTWVDSHKIRHLLHLFTIWQTLALYLTVDSHKTSVNNMVDFFCSLLGQTCI